MGEVAEITGIDKQWISKITKSAGWHRNLVMRKNIRMPKTAAVIGHLLYSILLIPAYIYL